MKPIGLSLLPMVVLLSVGLVEGGGGWFGGDSYEVKELKNIVRELNQRNSELVRENGMMQVSIDYQKNSLEICQGDLAISKKIQEQFSKMKEIQLIQKLNLEGKDLEIDDLKIDIENAKTELRKAQELSSKLEKDLSKKEVENYRLKKDAEVSKEDLIRTLEEGTRRSTELAERKEEHNEIPNSNMALLKTIWETAEKNRNSSDRCIDALKGLNVQRGADTSYFVMSVMVGIIVVLGTTVCILGYSLHIAQNTINSLASAPRVSRTEARRPRSRARETADAAQALNRMQNAD